MDTFLAILRVIWAIVITVFVVIVINLIILWAKITIDTNAKVTAIYNNLGLDTIPSDSVNLNRGDTINFNVIFK